MTDISEHYNALEVWWVLYRHDQEPHCAEEAQRAYQLMEGIAYNQRNEGR